MCGIIGIIGSSSPSERKVSLDTIFHRGPDGEGEWHSQDERVWLGHRRLAIIDPEGGKQPISNEDGTVWITFNGCIYNYLELAQSLRAKGHRFKTHSDTEVIVHAYEEYGEECLDKFIGMFAFAIWDTRREVLFCARDRIGVKPFYYSAANGKFIFSSEIKAIIAASGRGAEADRDSIGKYIVFQTVLGEETLFRGVKKLLPGHSMTVDRNGSILRNKSYWELRFDMDVEHDEDYLLDHLQMLIRDAVKIRLRSDVPLGAHLSGGLDSSTVVALASELGVDSEALSTFTGGFSYSPAYDETSYAKLVAEKVGATYHEVRPGVSDFQKYIGEIIYHMDEPSAGPGVFPQFMVSKLASEHVKVVLGGQGGDEIFGGYARYLIGYLEECLKGAIEETEHKAHYVATLQTIIPNLSLLKQYTPMLQYFWSDGLFGSQEDRYFRLMDRSAGLGDIYDKSLLSGKEGIRESFNEIFFSSDAASFLNRMLCFDLKVHLPALLHVEDRTSMAWGLESRVPLLDHRIVELVAHVPPTIKFKGGQPKYLFKRAIKNIIPEEILNRKDKMGFPVPLHAWLKGPLKDFTHDLLFSEKAKGRGIFNPGALEKAIENEKDFGRVVWGAICMELWFKTFIDGTPQPVNCGA